MGWWSDTDEEDDSGSLSDIPMAAVTIPSAFLGMSLGQPSVTTAQRRQGQFDLYGSFSARPCGQRGYRNWLTPFLEYFSNSLARLKRFWRPRHLRRMTRRFLRRLGRWVLEIEMGFVWGVAGLSIFIFVFAAIWYIDPALLTLVLRFKEATCTTVSSAFLIGVSNCSWTSCKLGCTRDVYKCWQVQVKFQFIPDAPVYSPPWASLSTFDRGGVNNADYSDEDASVPATTARLYPNVRGCGYPPELNCEKFYEDHMKISTTYKCWVSTMDTSVAMTALDLERAKDEVILSLIPLLIFIVFILYAFCRHGVFSICNPLRACGCHRADEIRAGADTLRSTNEDSGEVAVDKSVSPLSPKKLLDYKRSTSSIQKSNVSLTNVSDGDIEDINNFTIPPTIKEDTDDEELVTIKFASQSSSSKSTQKLANKLIHQKSSNSLLLPSNASLTSIDDPQNKNSLSQSQSTPLYTSDIHGSGESRRRRNKRNKLSDTEGFECRTNASSGVSSKGRSKDKDFLIHRLSDDQFELHDTGEQFSKHRNPSTSRDTTALRPSSHLNIGNILGDDDVEMLVLAGDAHEDNQTVIKEIFTRKELHPLEREPSSKPYHDLDLDLNIFDDKTKEKGNFHLGIDLGKYENSTLKTIKSDGKNNRHSSYISDVMNMDSNDPTERLQPRAQSPDSLDSFNFLPDLNEVGGKLDDNKSNPTSTNPKHLRTSRQPASAAKDKAPSIEGGNFDTDSFLDL